MQNNEPASATKIAPSVRTVDMVVAFLLFLVGVLVLSDSHRIGASWDADGPQAGYFPFWVGVLIALASAVNLVQVAFRRDAGSSHTFVSAPSLLLVLAVFVPSAIFVGAIYFIGLYVSAAIFIGVFMRWQGRFKWLQVFSVSLVVPVALFFVFEIWFLVPLPKGPVEALIGY